MLEEKVIEYLKKQKETEYKFEDVDKLHFAHMLIENIGDLDPVVRDELIYPNLAHLLHDKHFNEEQLTEILHLLIGDEYLHFDLDNNIEFSVLIRSFTLLQLVILVDVHNRDNRIDEIDMRELLKSFIDYFQKEENLTGYDSEKGWLHSIAHSADLFAQLVKCEWVKERELKLIFKSITTKYKTKEYYFKHDEDERLINAIENGLERDILGEEFLTIWIEMFSRYEKIKEYPEAYHLTNNVKLFLRSLYFRLIYKDKYQFLTDKIKEVLKENVKLN